MSSQSTHEKDRPVTLRTLASRLGLSLTAVSIVVNDSPAAKTIPSATRERILAAAQELQYRPNYLARSLRNKRSMSIGVLRRLLHPGDEWCRRASVGSRAFLPAGSASLAARAAGRNPRMLLERSVDGLLLINAPTPARVGVPIVSVSGYQGDAGVTNIQLNHKQAALLALKHLASLAHRRIVFMEGLAETVDTECRWRRITGIHRESLFPVSAQTWKLFGKIEYGQKETR